MRRLFIGMAVLTVCLMAMTTCRNGEVKAASQNESKIRMSAEDSSMFVEVFQAYLDYEQGYADSAAAMAKQVEYLGQRLAEGADDRYMRNLAHVDSVLHECISLVGMRNNDRLLQTLEAERMNFYSHPGNLIDNEIALGIVFGKLYNQVYPEAEDSFYMKMLPIYEFTEVHMKLLEMMGKGRHPFYDNLQQLMDRAAECLHSFSPSMADSVIENMSACNEE